MRIHETVQRLEGKPQKKADTVTQEEAEYAGRLYRKFLNYQDGLGEIPWNPPTEEEMKFLADVMDRISRQGKSA